MHLYLIRHAHAVALGHNGVHTDAERPLSSDGRAQCPPLAEALTRLEVRLDKLITSPLVRAHQTAELVLEHLPQLKPAFLENEELAPGGRRRKLTAFLRSLHGEHLAIVGHNPDLSVYLAWLIGGKKAQIELAKAGVALVEFEGRIAKGAGTLAWLVTPAWCPASAKADQ